MKETPLVTVLVEKNGPLVRISLNRQRVRNAFNDVMIRELTDAFRAAERDPEVRLVILTGLGGAFCAGADLNWMREIVRYSYEQNIRESLEISDLLRLIYTLPKPTIARVNGAAVGGGCGLFSACDIVVASTLAEFGLSEVKIGLVPAAISPYVIRRMGESRARELFLTGERFGAGRALELGLVNRVAGPDELDAATDRLAALILDSGPEAIAKAKELLERVPAMNPDEARTYTAEVIARIRVSAEGQEGMAAFLEKRKPRWAKG